MADQRHKLIVEISGPEDEIQKMLEEIEGLVDQNGQVELNAVTLRND